MTGDGYVATLVLLHTYYIGKSEALYSAILRRILTVSHCSYDRSSILNIVFYLNS